MSNRKKFSKEEIKNVGLRIKASRVLTGLNQEEFGIKYHIPVPSIKTWEFGSVVPRLDGLNKFTAALRECGIYVSSDWLIHGTGTGPCYFLGNSERVADYNYAAISDEMAEFKMAFQKECKKNKENPVFVEVYDEEMSPIFKSGDIVAGILRDKSNLKEIPYKPMLVNIGNEKYVVRYLHIIDNEFFICSLKSPTIRKINIESYGDILWHKIN